MGINSLLEKLYYIGYSLNKRYKLKRQKRLSYPVISIGNITVGGTGKTPATIAIAEEAKKRGFQPIVITRGYKGKAKGPCFVLARKFKGSEEKDPRNSALPQFCYSVLEAGDEPVLMAERLKDVPIVKCSDRFEGGMFAIKNFKSQISNLKYPIIFILDDGFQHWKLHRDIDIVLIDGLNPFGNMRMLPMGPLREPLNELKRADIFVVTKAKNTTLSAELRSINPKAPVYFSEYRILRLMDIRGNDYPIEMLRDKKVYAFCGIANPYSFRHTVLSISGKVVGFKTYRDHHCYRLRDMIYLIKQGRYANSDFLLTTEKDMVKIKEIRDFRCEIQKENILSLQVDFSVEPDFFDEVFKNIP